MYPPVIKHSKWKHHPFIGDIIHWLMILWIYIYIFIFIFIYTYIYIYMLYYIILYYIILYIYIYICIYIYTYLCVCVPLSLLYLHSYLYISQPFLAPFWAPGWPASPSPSGRFPLEPAPLSDDQDDTKLTQYLTSPWEMAHRNGWFSH